MNEEGKRLIRVFPRRTSATPVDALSYCGPPDFWAEADLVHISVTFSWDVPLAERLAAEWARVAPVLIGGPAVLPPQGPFIPGRYLRPGYVITSRGCPNRCWFCQVRTLKLEELPICDGWIVQDDNLLACSQRHVRAVFEMLSRQTPRVEFRGGLEAARLEDWHVDLLAGLQPKPVVWFSYDDVADYEPLRRATKMLLHAEFRPQGHRIRCYVLIGQPLDEPDYAEDRLRACLELGLTPMAMLYHPADGQTDRDWRRLARQWARPRIIHAGE